MERLIRVSKQKVSLLLDNLKVIWYKKVDTSNSRKRSKITRVRKVDKMAQEQRKYEKEYKVQAVKLAKEIGAGKAAKELGIPVDTLYGWQKAVREGRLDAGPGSRGPGEAMSLAEELGALRKQIKALERENRRLKEENEFLAEASAFFAASRRKSARNSE